MVNITASIGNENFRTEIKGSNTIIADEPKEKGGQNLGLNPGELLAASLASCSLITMKMYAQRKNWDLQHAFVEISYDHDEKEHTANMIKHITLTGTLDEEQRSRLKYIAGVCPVHRLLEKSIHIESFLTDAV
ncbi:MAG: osmotically inducible protein OsmC [Flavobacterium sp. BFFFF1]|uniref:OsmC family protein n=1 Tax=Flavobacterium sp. BFFFF1 TaxID=2015557 RepID=UPI000BCC4277|nr:OsmC family protein [Flavobacterium sp. BFFFF1]OYU79978.1 MAG: osmotically inducible protein OsmC [Flavobacterium sp. BFFFF1]